MKFLSELKWWIVFALSVRFVSAITHSHWGHPDEWAQTVEFANLLVNGFASHTQEVGLHLRGQTWPFLLSIPLSVAKLIDPIWIGLRIFLVQLFSGIFDLGILWGFWQLFNFYFSYLKTDKYFYLYKNICIGLFLVPWFYVADSVRPSMEHVSAVFLFLSLGFLCKRWFLFAGFFAVGIGAVRYPSGLFSVGILIAVLVSALKKKDFRQLYLLLSGIVLGLVVFGIPDWIVYGRPWESLWMYLQYNVFTGLGASKFGAQSAIIYLDYFHGHWKWFLMPFGILILLFGAVGLGLGVIRFNPWAWALLMFVLGHLLTKHKEPRFMAAVEVLIVWGGFYGFVLIAPKLKKIFFVLSEIKAIRVLLKYCVLIILSLNALFLLRALWGENLVTHGTYFEINKHLKNLPNTCAVISVKRPFSIHFPFGTTGIVPEPAFAFFPANRRVESFPEVNTKPLIWIEREPVCAPDMVILLHLDKPDKRWDYNGCTLLVSGVLRLVPKSFWPWIIDNGYLSGPWYKCKESVLKVFKNTEIRKILAETTGFHKSLPPLGIKGGALIKMGQNALPQPLPGDGTLCDW